jgi:hypothetical protein
MLAPWRRRRHGPAQLQDRLQQEKGVAAAGKADGQRRAGGAIKPPIEDGSNRF